MRRDSLAGVLDLERDGLLPRRRAQDDAARLRVLDRVGENVDEDPREFLPVEHGRLGQVGTARRRAIPFALRGLSRSPSRAGARRSMRCGWRSAAPPRSWRGRGCWIIRSGVSALSRMTPRSWRRRSRPRASAVPGDDVERRMIVFSGRSQLVETVERKSDFSGRAGELLVARRALDGGSAAIARPIRSGARAPEAPRCRSVWRCSRPRQRQPRPRLDRPVETRNRRYSSIRRWLLVRLCRTIPRHHVHDRRTGSPR
jgi:hypothetical protein